MLITNKNIFLLGIGLALSFALVFACMFGPFFGDNKNAFEASDQMFNSISKGSINYIPALIEQAEQFDTTMVSALVLKEGGDIVGKVKSILLTNEMSVTNEDNGLRVNGSLGQILRIPLNDSEIMFNNRGDVLVNRYEINEKEVMHAWWQFLRSLDLALKNQQMFTEATFTSNVMTKAVEVGYNYYGIEPESAMSKVGMLTFALIFYVIYTIWWGYAIFFLFEGFGLAMTAGTKKEV